MFVVEYDQWYRCGPNGDDKDFEIIERQFETREEAEKFVNDVLNGFHDGFGYSKVKKEDIHLFEKSA